MEFSRQECWSGLPFPSPGRGFPCGSAGKESICNAGDLGLIPGLGRSPGEGEGYPLQYSGYIVRRVAELDMTERLSFSFKILGAYDGGKLAF